MEIQEPTAEEWAARTNHAWNVKKYARIVAMKLGVKHSKKHGSNMVYTAIHGTHIIRIMQDTYADNMSVHLGDSWVMDVHLGQVTRFIPRIEWLIPIVELGRVLLAAERAEKERKQLEERMKVLRKWGFVE